MYPKTQKVKSKCLQLHTKNSTK